MKISVKIDGLDALQAKLRGLSDGKIKVAAVSALNVAARAGAEETKKAMAQTFDRPTPWVLGGVRYVKARKDRLEASIDFDQWGNKTNVTVGKVLQAEIFGGQRKHKRHEIALQRAGILPAGMAIVPGPGAIKDQYGNMRAAQIVQIMAWFKSFGQQGYKANSTDKSRARLAKDKKNGTRGFQYFAVAKKTGNLIPGIYQRFTFGAGSSIRPIMYFVKSTNYKRRLDFYGIAERFATAEFKRAFPYYLDKLLKERGL